MSVPNNNLVRNAKIKKGNKAKKKAAWIKPNPMKLTPYRYVKAIERSAQFQALQPQLEELVDLTDDLAPEVSATNTFNTMQLPAPATQQYSATGSENKLNFKFQKTISKKTPDWTKYQNNFKRISAASPDSDHGEQVEQTPVSTGAQKEIVDLTDQGKNDDALSALPISVMEVVKAKLKDLPAGKKPIIMPSVVDPPIDEEQPKKEPKEVAKETHNVTKDESNTKKTPVSLKPIEVRCPRGQINHGHLRYKKPSVQSVYDYPHKGIPKSFLIHQDQKAESPTQPTPSPSLQKPVFEYPKGIPRSFLKQQEEKIDPPSQPTPAPLPQNPLFEYPKGIPRSFYMQEWYNIDPPSQPAPTQWQNSVPEYQIQSGLDLPSWILGSQPNPEPVEQSSIYDGLEIEPGPNSPTFAQRDQTPNRPYSPSDAYSEIAAGKAEEAREGSESPDLLQSGQKRLSAFQRLGPLTKPKKPKLTINLMFNKEQSVREVVDESAESLRFVPVHLRRDILQSNDEIVKKYLPFWPWKKNFVTRKSVSVRQSKSVMILEQEQMETAYEKDNMFIQVSVKGYPITWTKEDVLDAILECVKGKSFIPCFIEFTPQECKFLVIRSRSALVILHKVGFCVRAASAELTVTISLTETSLKQLDLIPRLVLRRRMLANQNESSLDLSNFLAGTDVSHFVYFPLSRVTNQVEMIQLHSAVAWEYLTELNLSNNRISSLDGFDLQSTTPKLRHLDLSHNLLDKVTILLKFRDLPLRSIKLEGNPLCLDYIDTAHYIKVVKMIFSGLRELDGVTLTFKGDLPPSKRNFCPEEAAGVAEKFLETFFPLLEAPYDDRAAIEHMYEKDAVMTVTFRYKLRYGSAFRYFRNLFVRSRNLEEGDVESIRGAPSIGDLITKWPPIEHDRYTITVDVMHHDESTTILRIWGVLKLTAETLAEDEHLLTFTRTVVLHTKNGTEYKIQNEMLYWDVPCEELTQTAFNITTVRSKQPSLKLESPPDEELKSKLLGIFMKLADIDKKRGERCLEIKNWDLRSALDYYVKLLKLDDFSPLNEPEKELTPVP